MGDLLRASPHWYKILVKALVCFIVLEVIFGGIYVGINRAMYHDVYSSSGHDTPGCGYYTVDYARPHLLVNATQETVWWSQEYHRTEC